MGECWKPEIQKIEKLNPEERSWASSHPEKFSFSVFQFLAQDLSSGLSFSVFQFFSSAADRPQNRAFEIISQNSLNAQ